MIFIMTAIVGMVGFFSDDSTALATPQHDAFEESKAGLDSAPDNLGLDPKLFTIGDFSKYNTKNTAFLEDAMGRSAAAGGKDLRAIKMNYYTDQQGAVWSNVEGGNSIDITQPQTLSAWLYFGPKEHTNTDYPGFGEGMSFVIQNSGADAFANKNGNLFGGENMGAWGIDNDNTVSDPVEIANTAIQKSLAINFDTNANNTGTSGNDFDEGQSNQRIHYGYPGDPASYIKHTIKGRTSIFGNTPDTYYYSMDNSTDQEVELHDGKWHHLTVIWNPGNVTLTALFNDKNVDGTVGTNPTPITISGVKAAAFGLDASKKSDTPKLRWGFTASNGGNYEANLVAFESIPSEIQGKASANITDLTQNKTFEKTGEKVNSGDELAFNYNLQYILGNYEWSDDVATIDLPKNVTITNGDPNQVIGYVTYTDGSDAKAEPLYASEIKLVTVKATKKTKMALVHTIAKPLSESSSNATVTLYGTANNVTTDTNVPLNHANFASKMLITDTQTPDFTIQKSKPIELALDQSNISVDTGKDANITGTVKYDDQTTINNPDIKIHATLNETPLDTFSLGDDTNLSKATSGKLSFNIPSSKIAQENNTLKVYAEDKNGNVSKTITVLLAKTGGLSLNVENYSFGEVNQATPEMLIHRKGLWNIIVNDNRKDGIKSPWNLSANTSGLFTGTQEFKGNIVFRNPAGLESDLSNNSDVSIANGYKLGSGQESTNVGKSWSDSEGIMLRTTGLNTASTYSGKIYWNLSDTI